MFVFLSQDCEEWLEGLGLLAPLATASSARRSGCKQTPEDRKKDKDIITDQIDILPESYVSLHYKVSSCKNLDSFDQGLSLGNGLTEEFPLHTATDYATPHQITAQVVTLDNTQCLSVLIIIFIMCCDTKI